MYIRRAPSSPPTRPRLSHARRAIAKPGRPLRAPALDARARAGHMGGMPHHDSVPSRSRATDYQASATAWERYKAMMKWMALASAIAAALALVYLWVTDRPMPIHAIIATVAGVGLTVLLGTALMGLVFLSNRNGMDEGAQGRGRIGGETEQ